MLLLHVCVFSITVDAHLYPKESCLFTLYYLWSSQTLQHNLKKSKTVDKIVQTMHSKPV